MKYHPDCNCQEKNTAPWVIAVSLILVLLVVAVVATFLIYWKWKTPGEALPTTNAIRLSQPRAKTALAKTRKH